MSKRERSGSVVERLTQDRRAGGLSLTAVTALWSLSKTHLSNYPSLVLVQPRKTRPYITERLLMGRKESNQTNKHMSKCRIVGIYAHSFCLSVPTNIIYKMISYLEFVPPV